MRRNKLVVFTLTDHETARCRPAKLKDYPPIERVFRTIRHLFFLTTYRKYLAGDVFRCQDAKRAAAILLNKGYKSGEIKTATWYDGNGKKVDIIRDYKHMKATR
jgi:hypothetical protein